MRLASSLLLALPLLGEAAEGPFEQYRAQFQNFLGSFGSYLPKSPEEREQAKAEAKATRERESVAVLTLSDWKETLYRPVKAEEISKPEEWWVLVTGGNKTCFGKTPHLLGHGLPLTS